jgi:hypothetical protein
MIMTDLEVQEFISKAWLDCRDDNNPAHPISTLNDASSEKKSRFWKKKKKEESQHPKFVVIHCDTCRPLKWNNISPPLTRKNFFLDEILVDPWTAQIDDVRNAAKQDCPVCKFLCDVADAWHFKNTKDSSPLPWDTMTVELPIREMEFAIRLGSNRVAKQLRLESFTLIGRQFAFISTNHYGVRSD